MEAKIPKGKAVSWICTGFVIGILLFSFVTPLPLREGVFALAACGLLLMIFRRASTRLAWQRVICLALGAAVGMCRYAASVPAIGVDHISYYNGETVELRGIVGREPIDKRDGWQLTLNVSSLARTDRQMKIKETRPVHGLILVSVPPLPAYDYGDELELACRLEKPENKDFPYDRYLARYGIYSLCSRAKISRLAQEKGNPIFAFIVKIKKKTYSIAQAYLPEPAASLALPVVFGGGQGIDDDITDEFRRTGLTHIMAVSGFNVSLLAALLGWMLLIIGASRRSAFYLASLVIAAYVLMVGAPASAVRAGVMSIFLLLALTVGRLASLPRSVLLVAAATLLANPRLLRDDIGWQLSFLALLGLMYILPRLEKWTLAMTRGRGKSIVTALMATVAAQLATAPVILYNFGNFSLIAPLANLLVVWVVPILTIAMLLALPLAAIFPALGGFLFFPAWIMIKYIFFIVHILSGLSWAAITLQ